MKKIRVRKYMIVVAVIAFFLATVSTQWTGDHKGVWFGLQNLGIKGPLVGMFWSRHNRDLEFIIWKDVETCDILVGASVYPRFSCMMNYNPMHMQRY